MKKEKTTFVQEFKAFIVRGNVIDLAVGIIVGTAFTTIVNSLVKDVVMPPISLLLGRVNITELSLVLQPAGIDSTGKEIPEIALHYGAFLQNVLNFLIISIVVFVLIKLISRVRKDEEKKPEVKTKK